MISHLNALQQPQTNVTISQRYCGVAPVTGAGSGMCVSTPSKESQIICFLPLEIIKTLTRICANFARPGSLVCACLASALSSPLHSSFLSLSPLVLCVAPSSARASLPLRPSKQSSGRREGVGMRGFTGLESTAAMITPQTCLRVLSGTGAAALIKLLRVTSCCLT